MPRPYRSRRSPDEAYAAPYLTALVYAVVHVQNVRVVLEEVAAG